MELFSKRNGYLIVSPVKNNVDFFPHIFKAKLF